MLHARFCSHLSHLSSLQRIWRPVSRFDLQGPVLDIQIIPEITIPVTGTVGPIVMITGGALLHQIHLSVAEDLLHPDTYLMSKRRILHLTGPLITLLGRFPPTVFRTARPRTH
jgi:hypothetical protein